MRATLPTVNILLYSFALLLSATPGFSNPRIFNCFLPYRSNLFQTGAVVYPDGVINKRTPLVVLHGGPGFTYDYMSPIGDLLGASGSNRTVIFYDQLGNGMSYHDPQANPSSWNVDLFVDQLQCVIQYFEIESDFALLGHGWGSTLALEFAVRRGTAGLKGLILTDGPASMALYGQSMGQLLQEFPQSVQQGFANGFNNRSAFEQAFRTFTAVHGLRMTPTPAEVNRTLFQVFGTNGIGGDPTVAKVTSLTPPDWSIIDRLPSIKTRTLVINGRYSPAQDFVVQPFADRMPNATWVKGLFQRSSQMPWWEEPSIFKNIVEAFLESISWR